MAQQLSPLSPPEPAAHRENELPGSHAGRSTDFPQAEGAAIGAALPMRWHTFYYRLLYFRAAAGFVLVGVWTALEAYGMRDLGIADAVAIVGVSYPLLQLSMSILDLLVARGLSQRMRWAWRVNWFVLAITCINWGQSAAGFVAWRTLVGALVWFAPNWLYFRKRRALFVPAPDEAGDAASRSPRTASSRAAS